MIQPIKERV